MANLKNLIKIFLEHIESVEQQKCIDILNQLSECEGFNVNTFYIKDKNNNITLLIKASIYNCLDVVKYLIEVLHADPNKQDDQGWTALYYASDWYAYETIDYLISMSVNDVNKQDSDGGTVLHYVAYDGCTKSVKALLKSNNLDTNLRDVNGITAEETARSRGFHEIADMIADYEPSISAFDNK